MVVASILIHGLSIPFFSLGRRVHSVSRTWSRHATLEPTPEWATHTRAVSRPEDIVINRDADALERGEVPTHVKDEVDSGVSGEEKFLEGVEAGREEEKRDVIREVGREGGVPIVEEGREGSGSETAQGSMHALGERKLGEEEGQDYKEQNLPDGEDTVQEWKEGPHKIIERRAGPGEEVEVEVQRNAYAKHPDSDPVTFRGAEGHVHDVATQFMHGLRHAPKDAEKAFEKVEEKAEQAVENLSPHLAPTSPTKPSKATTEGQAGPSNSTDAGGHGGDEDEGWASDGTTGRGTSGKRSGSSPGSKHGKRRLFMHGVGRIGRRKPTTGNAAGSRGASSRPSSGASTGPLLQGPDAARRRSPSPAPSSPIVVDYATRPQSQSSLAPTQSIPAIVTDFATPSPSTTPEDESPNTPDESRGRPPPRPDAGGRRRSRQHHRLDTLRREGGGSFGSRDSSPARSIRWADEAGGPRSPLPLSPTSDTFGDDVGADRDGGDSGDEDAGGRGGGPRSSTSVRFELPGAGEGGR